MTNHIPIESLKNKTVIRRTADGDIDTHYYIEKGRNARSDAAIELMKTVRAYCRKHLKIASNKTTKL